VTSGSLGAEMISRQTGKSILWRYLTPDVAIALAAAIVAFFVRMIALSRPSIEYDEGVYWQSLRAMTDGHALFSSVFSSQPPFFLLSIYPFYVLFGQSLAAARFAVVVYSLLGIAAAYWIGRRLSNPWAGVFVVLLLALEPRFTAESYALQAEVPMLGFSLVSVALSVETLHHSGKRRIWLAAAAGVACGLAIMIKLFAVVTLIPVVLFLATPLVEAFMRGDGRREQALREEVRPLARDLAAMAAGVVGAIVILLLPFVTNLGRVYDQVIRFHLVAAKETGLSWQDNLGNFWKIEQQSLSSSMWPRRHVSSPAACMVHPSFSTQVWISSSLQFTLCSVGFPSRAPFQTKRVIV
jgi:hypothetical protein